VNCAGISAYKLIMLLESHRADVVCLQETWMRQGADELSLPGYRWFEQRRSGRRGGIAILVKEGLHVSRAVGNEYAQLVELRTHSGAMCTLANAYLPPNNNLGRRQLTEQGVRDACQSVLGRIDYAQNVLVCGDFNARTGQGVPT
jgi:exonuclease III